MKKLLIILIVFFLFIGLISADTIQKDLTLTEGWNTIGIDSEISFNDDIRNECSFAWWNADLADSSVTEDDISESNRHYVWTQLGGQWSHPDLLSAEKGYSIYSNNNCQLTLELDEEDIEYREEIDIRSGWNTINLLSDLEMYKVWNECERENGIGYWNPQMADDEIGGADIHEDNRYRFHIEDGMDWEYPLKTEYSIQETDGAYVYGLNDCTVNITEDFASIENAELSANEFGEPEGLEINLDLGVRHEEYVEDSPKVSVFKDNEEVIEKETTWNVDTLSVDWDDLWSGEKEENVTLGLILEDNNNGDYWWDEKNHTLDNVNITRCGPSHDFSEYHHDNNAISCIEKNPDINTDLIEEETNWTVRSQSNSVHDLESINLEASEDSHELSLDTGSSGYCGSVYFETNSLEGSYSFSLNMEDLEDSSPQEVFVEIDDREMYNINSGESEEFEKEIPEDTTLKIGLSDTSDNLGCDDFSSRTSFNTEIRSITN